MQAQAQLSGAVRLATSLARPGSGGGTVLCIELCGLSTAARASSIYFSRPPQFLILIRQRVTQLH